MLKMPKIVTITSLISISLSANFLMSVIDENNIKTQQCVKNYSYSNNLESTHRKNVNHGSDIYSTEETLINKIWIDGKPIYRRVFSNLMGFTESGSFNKWRSVSFNNSDDNVEKLVSAEIDFNNRHERFTFFNKTSQFRYSITSSGITYVSKKGYVNSKTKATVILEYTKTTDETSNSSENTYSNNNTKLETYVHYLPSSSDNFEIKTQYINNKYIKFTPNYTYDKDTDTCIKN